MEIKYIEILLLIMATWLISCAQGTHLNSSLSGLGSSGQSSSSSGSGSGTGSGSGNTPPPSPPPTSNGACTKYVSPSGNAGGHSTPYKTITAAVNTLVPGDTLCVDGGSDASHPITYNEQVFVMTSGTSAQPITIRALNTTIKPVVDGQYILPTGPSSGSYQYSIGGVTSTTQCYEATVNTYGKPVDPNANLGPWPKKACAVGYSNNPDKMLVKIQGNYVVWDSIDVVNSRGHGVIIGNGTKGGWGVDNPDTATWYNHITFQNSVVAHHRIMGVVIMYADTVSFLNNDVSDAGNFADYDHVSAMYDGGQFNQINNAALAWPNAVAIVGKNINVIGNVIHDTYTEGLQVGLYVLATGTFNHVENLLVRGNTIYNTFSDEIYAGNFNGLTIDGNLIYNTGDPKYFMAPGNTSTCLMIANERGSDGSGNASYLTNSDFVATNNIITGCTDLLHLRSCNNCASGAQRATYQNVSIFNNTVVNPLKGGSVLQNSMSQVTGFSMVNNLFYAPAGTSIIAKGGDGFALTKAVMTFSHNLWSADPVGTDHWGATVDLSGVGDVISASPGVVNINYKATAGVKYDPSQMRLTSSSPAVGQGLSESSITLDFFGVSRVGKAFDIGASQH